MGLGFRVRVVVSRLGFRVKVVSLGFKGLGFKEVNGPFRPSQGFAGI